MLSTAERYKVDGTLGRPERFTHLHCSSRRSTNDSYLQNPLLYRIFLSNVVINMIIRKVLPLVLIGVVCTLSGCATITEDANTPIAISLSDGSTGTVTLTNKRGSWSSPLPGTVSVRKSDDGLRYDATSKDGRRATGVIPSEMGAKIVASAVFIDFGITDAITDKHRKYPVSYVIPIQPASSSADGSPPTTNTVATRLSELEALRQSGAITEAEYNKKRKDIVDSL